jgi:hypothetical protein
MLEIMYVRCGQCGYDNSPEYRFCGMCGGSLPHPAKEASQPERDVLLPPTPAPVPLSTPAPAPIAVSATALGGGERVHGPSFLGLSDDSKEDLSYEDDEEPKRSRAGLIAVVVLLIAAAGLVGWQWRHDGFPFNRKLRGAARGQLRQLGRTVSMLRSARSRTITQPGKPRLALRRMIREIIPHNRQPSRQHNRRLEKAKNQQRAVSLQPLHQRPHPRLPHPRRRKRRKRLRPQRHTVCMRS